MNSWRWSIVSKCSKFYVDFKNAKKVSENVFGFEDKCIGTCYRNFSLLWEENMWSAANVLKDGPNISDSTKRHDTQLTFFDINGKLAWKCCRADFSSVWNPLTRWLRKGVLKQEFAFIQVTTFFEMNNSRNIEGMKAIFVLENGQNFM